MLRAPTPADRLLDAQGRPYFLWDVTLTFEAWLAKLESPDLDERAYWLARALRDAKPDDALEWTTLATIAALWPRLHRHLGEKRAFWRWLLEFNGHAIACA